MQLDTGYFIDLVFTKLIFSMIFRNFESAEGSIAAPLVTKDKIVLALKIYESIVAITKEYLIKI